MPTAIIIMNFLFEFPKAKKKRNVQGHLINSKVVGLPQEIIFFGSLQPIIIHLINERCGLPGCGENTSLNFSSIFPYFFSRILYKMWRH
jgi:hypothetical protein